jgi:type I restriction enzyme S subunit
MIGWKEYKIGDLCNTISETYKSNDDEVILINTSDVLDGKLLNHVPVPNENLKGQFKKTFRMDDILYSEIRPANKRFAFVDIEDTSLYIASTKLMVLRPNTEIIEPKFLFALLSSKNMIDELQVRAESRSGTFPQITFGAELAPIKVMVPDKDIQLKIVSFMEAFQGKLDTNEAINRNLEEQVNTIYKSWFVDFEPFDGVTPEEWSTGVLKDVLQLRKDGMKAGENTELPYLPIDVIPMNDLAIHDIKPNEEAKSSLITFNKNDILIGAMRVYFHRVVIAPFDGITRSTCFVLRPYDEEYLGFGLLCCNQNSSIEYAQSTSKGSTMPYAVWENGLGDMDIIIPDKKTATLFNEIVKPMLEIIQQSFYENQRLQGLRDSLLPRLMSGELDVSDLEI